MPPFYTEPTDADDDEMADIDQAIAFTRTTMALPSRAMRQRVGIIPLFPCCISCITCSPLSERRKYFSGGVLPGPCFAIQVCVAIQVHQYKKGKFVKEGEVGKYSQQIRLVVKQA